MNKYSKREIELMIEMIDDVLIEDVLEKFATYEEMVYYVFRNINDTIDILEKNYPEIATSIFKVVESYNIQPNPDNPDFHDYDMAAYVYSPEDSDTEEELDGVVIMELKYAITDKLDEFITE